MLVATTYVNPFVKLPLCAPVFVTVTVTVPALSAGAMAVMVVLFTTTTLVAAVAPNVTVAPVAKFVPVIVTAVATPANPLFGDTPVTVGTPIKVNPLARLPLCPPTVTVTVTGPALPAGALAVMVVLFTTTTLVATPAPNVTVAPVAKFVPVIVTAVPPAANPLFGDTPLTVGIAT
jgi:hypothetical protein